MIYFTCYCPLNSLTLQFCKCDVSVSIITRGLKFYQLIDDGLVKLKKYIYMIFPLLLIRF